MDPKVQFLRTLRRARMERRAFLLRRKRELCRRMLRELKAGAEVFALYLEAYCQVLRELDSFYEHELRTKKAVGSKFLRRRARQPVPNC
jgi:hypothetical protein